MNQSQGHTLVATAMIATALTVAIAQDWWLEVRYYIESRTSKTPPAKPTNANIPDSSAVIKWLVGIGGTWIVLTFLVDLGDTAELAEALAFAVVASVLMTQGPQALTNLGFLTDAQAAVTGAKPSGGS